MKSRAPGDYRILTMLLERNGVANATGVMAVIAAREIVAEGKAEIIFEDVDAHGAGTIDLRAVKA